MTQQVASSMSAAIMLFAITIFTTRMRQDHWLIIWLFEATTKASVSRQRVFSIVEVAIWASPSIEGHHCLRCLPRFIFLSVISDLLHLFITQPHSHCIMIMLCNLALFSVLIFSSTVGLFIFFARVELVDPSFDAAQVKWLAALLAVPEGTSLVDVVRADYAFLGTEG